MSCSGCGCAGITISTLVTHLIRATVCCNRCGGSAYSTVSVSKVILSEVRNMSMTTVSSGLPQALMFMVPSLYSKNCVLNVVSDVRNERSVALFSNLMDLIDKAVNLGIVLSKLRFSSTGICTSVNVAAYNDSKSCAFVDVRTVHRQFPCEFAEERKYMKEFLCNPHISIQQYEKIAYFHHRLEKNSFACEDHH